MHFLYLPESLRRYFVCQTGRSEERPPCGTNPDGGTHQPGRVIRNTHLTGQLHGGHPVFVLREKIESQKPGAEGELGAGKDRSAGGRGLMPALVTLQQMSVGQGAISRVATSRTRKPFVATQKEPSGSVLPYHTGHKTPPHSVPSETALDSWPYQTFLKRVCCCYGVIISGAKKSADFNG